MEMKNYNKIQPDADSKVKLDGVSFESVVIDEEVGNVETEEVLKGSAVDLVPTPEYKKVTYSVLPMFLNVREEPNLESKVVTILKKGSALFVEEIDNDEWIKVSRHEYKGYVKKSLVMKHTEL